MVYQAFLVSKMFVHCLHVNNLQSMCKHITITNNVRTMYEHVTNNVRTMYEHVTNNVRTCYEQCTNNVRTCYEQPTNTATRAMSKYGKVAAQRGTPRTFNFDSLQWCRLCISHPGVAPARYSGQYTSCPSGLTSPMWSRRVRATW